MAAHHVTVAPFIPPYSLAVDFDEPKPIATMAEAIMHAIEAMQSGQAETTVCIMDAVGRVWSMRRQRNGDVVSLPY